MALGAGARLEWLPQEVILFDGAMLQRRQEFALGAGAELLLAEMLVFGRAANGRPLLSKVWWSRSEGALIASQEETPVAVLVAASR